MTFVTTLGSRSRRLAITLIAVAVAAPAARAQTAGAGSTSTGVRGVTEGTAKGSSRGKSSTRKRSSSKTRTRTAALRYTMPLGELSLVSDLQTMLSAKVRSGDWGISVISLSRGDTLFSLNPDQHFLPASTLKLYTTALAFERLGPAHQFTTDVVTEGVVAADGVLTGSLVLRGGGDPSLSNRFVHGDPNAPMRALARQVHASGVRTVSGDVIGDATAFEDKRIPDGWRTRYLEASYAQRVSALSLNENLLHVVINPAAGGQAGLVTLTPGTLSYKVLNRTRTVAGSRGAKLTVSRQSDGTIVAKGWIGSRSEARVYVVVVDDPALFATGAFLQALRDEGVKVTGTARTGTVPNATRRLAALSSPPLFEIASVMNRESINHLAELVFRDVAREGDPHHVGTALGANAMLQHFMTSRVGARADAVYAADGSGLSTLDRVTPRSLVQLLSYADRAAWSREFHESLPVAGRSELLRHRMTATPAQGNLHAKTGTTDEVIALGGYVTARNGEELAFSFIYNGHDRWSARETIDAMGATLASFSR
jgi:D-alanyl-D-alanine carboxypeptidase/D-alanyl-D-alanine-endopeptidase (penicillin-binding protein 4)